jgi:hypothetical protein
MTRNARHVDILCEDQVTLDRERALSGVRSRQLRFAGVADQVAIRRLIDLGAAAALLTAVELLPIFLILKLAGVRIEDHHGRSETPSGALRVLLHRGWSLVMFKLVSSGVQDQ